MPIKFYTPTYDAFDNFSAHAVEYNGKLYPTSEHAYQAAKYPDDAHKEKIRQARSPLLAKKISAALPKAAKDPDWQAKKVDIMEKILHAKLAQHDDVKQKLAQTGSEDIIENSPDDYFWGIGANGSGQNMLGKTWMKIRDELPIHVTFSLAP